MTQEEILEYNKRCAEFLGKKLISKNDFNMLGEHAYTDEHEHTNWGIIEYLKFHSDWSWIMEVVEAIEKLKCLVVIQSNFCHIQEIGIKDNNFNPLIIASLYGKNKKEAVVEAINQFLIWYNENSK